MAENIRDLLVQLPPERIPEHIRASAEALDGLAQRISTSCNRDARNVSLYNLACHGASDLRRLGGAYPADIETVAWCARNIFETFLITSAILESPESLSRWQGQMANDELEMIEGFLGLAEGPSAAVEVLYARKAHIAAICEKHRIGPSKSFNISTPAKGAALEKEHSSLYKLTSKYVHPSSWVVNGSTEHVCSPDTLNLLLVSAQLYAGRLCQLILDGSGVETAPPN